MQTKSVAQLAGKKVLELGVYAGLGLVFASGMAFIFMVGVLAWLGLWTGVLVLATRNLKNTSARKMASVLRGLGLK
jgi:hypothetical protein